MWTLLYRDKVGMQDPATRAVASFHTAFTFQITGDNSSNHGDGLTFTFVREMTATGDPGGSLCLLPAANNGMASNRVFAVEFDTYQNQGFNDPSDSHIGVDVNSVNSTWSYNLCKGGKTNCSSLCNAGFFTAWIDYDSASLNLQVFFGTGSLYDHVPKPRNPLIDVTLAAFAEAEFLDAAMGVGFISSSRRFDIFTPRFDLYQIQSWTFTSSGMDIQPSAESAPIPARRRKVVITTSVIIAGIILGASLAGFLIVKCRWYMKQGKFWDENVVPRMFTYKELSKATKNFGSSEFVGSGVCGEVYKGTLPSGALVAVKQMRMGVTHIREAPEVLAGLAQIHHQHLLQLRGWCHKKDQQLLLVYDYMCNGSLDKCLFPTREESYRFDVESLMLRHRILSDVGAALSYLHDECMVHQDIKSSNVLLDGEWNAYLGDCGLARVLDQQQMERMAKTSFGYMAPEMVHTSTATKESDVYSFGVMMLEVMCGMQPLGTSTIERGEGVLVDRVWQAHEAGDILQMADSRLEAFRPPNSDARNSGPHGEIETVQEVSPTREIELQEVSHVEMESLTLISNSSSIYAPDAETVDKKLIANLLHLGLLCCHPKPEDRPSMSLVSQLLRSTEYMEMSLPPLPQTPFPKQPKEYANVVAVEKLESHLKLAEECMEAVQKMSTLWKFNREQCGYLAQKLEVVIQSASWFLDRSRAECHRPLDSTRHAQNFKLLVALAKRIESFVQGCCKYEWIQAAVPLSNVSGYVSSLGFALELCRIAFCEDSLPRRSCLTLAEVGNINRDEVGIVEQKASVDVDTLLQKVTHELNFLKDENRDLASYLLQRLSRGGVNGPTSDDEIGKLFKCVISGEQLGRGASATVHKAMWLGTPVAKKTFVGCENSDFVKEVEILSKLCHPNITSMFFYAKSEQNCSIIMELMDEDLQKLMERRLWRDDGTTNSQPFLILEAVDIMLQVGEGVSYLHSKKIVHRGLKAMNILVKDVKTKNGEITSVDAEVTDFGLSKKQEGSVTYSNLTFNIGTNRWMPPEIIKLTTEDSQQNWFFSKHDKMPKYPFKCDSYSFGMVCYEILTGCVPFSHITSPKDMKKRVIEDHERPVLPPTCPSKLKALIQKCWSPKPEDRPTFATICLELKYLKYLLMTGNES